MNHFEILERLLGKEEWEKAHERGEFNGHSTQNLANMFFEIKERLGGEIANVFIRRKMKEIYEQLVDLRRLPSGAARARVVNMRMDKTIKSKFKNDPDTKRIVCTNCPIIGACCHTQVDITDDEAALLAERVKGGVTIDMERLEKQAVVGDNDDADDSRADEWGKLSYEERACVFLDENGMCRVYEDRPGSCRKWFVVENPPTCKDYGGGGMTYVSQEAEVLASAALNLESNRGRLPTKLLRELGKGKPTTQGETNGSR